VNRLILSENSTYEISAHYQFYLADLLLTRSLAADPVTARASGGNHRYLLFPQRQRTTWNAARTHLINQVGTLWSGNYCGSIEMND
jgi:hypothetical protein